LKVDTYLKGTRLVGQVTRVRFLGPDVALMHAVGVMRKNPHWVSLNASARSLYGVSGEGLPGPQSIGGTAVTIHVYVEVVDAAFNKAVAAGAQVRMPLEDINYA
jgi:PhnB protein